MTIDYVILQDRMEDAGSMAFWPIRPLGDYLIARDTIFKAIRAQKGKIDPEKTIQLLRNCRNPSSPCGPIVVDRETGDIIQNQCSGEVRRIRGELANFEIETITTQNENPLKEFNKKK